MSSSRRLPVYILLDTSGSMRGEPINSVNAGMQAMLAALRQDPYALESVYLSVITFDKDVRERLPLTALDQVQLPDIAVPESGATFLGAALELLVERFDRDVRRGSAGQKGDWRPLLFIMTDGSPTDLLAYREAIVQIRQRPFGTVVACAAGPKARQDLLRELTDQVVSLDTMDVAAFSGFFRWISVSVAAGSISHSTPASSGHGLPPPPPEVHVVI